MTTDGNKAIVIRFIKEVLGGGNIELIDELLAPDYVNPSMGVTNRNGFKAVISGLKASAPARDRRGAVPTRRSRNRPRPFGFADAVGLERGNCLSFPSEIKRRGCKPGSFRRFHVHHGATARYDTSGDQWSGKLWNYEQRSDHIVDNQ